MLDLIALRALPSALAATLLLGGCGTDLLDAYGENPVRTRALAHCMTVPAAGVYEKVRLHTANISCREAVEVFEGARVNETGQTERVEVRGEPGDGPNWFCVRLSQSKYPVFQRCQRKGHYFTIERKVVPDR